MNESVCDVLVFGAGIIGLSLALSLAQSNIKVIIVDHKKFVPIKHCTIPDIRVSAINYASVNFFKKINVWENIPDKFRISYDCVKTWEWASSTVTFRARSINLPEMGCIVENNRLKLALWQSIKNMNTIIFYCPFTFISLEYKGTFWKCILNDNTIIYSRLLIGADGTNSRIRKQLGIGVTTWKYNQCCMLLTIKSEKLNNKTIWQVFNPYGPIGFLPLYDNWGSLMWFDTPEYMQKLQSLSNSMLTDKIRKIVHSQLGDVTLHHVSVIPLIGQCSHGYISSNSALVGDAAHTIHPLAGQGINLGIRDVLSLSALFNNPNIFNKYSDSNFLEKLLISYQNNRYVDVYMMQFFINCLYLIFNNNFLPLKIARNIAFKMVNESPYVKKYILKYASGT